MEDYFLEGEGGRGLYVFVLSFLFFFLGEGFAAWCELLNVLMQASHMPILLSVDF